MVYLSPDVSSSSFMTSIYFPAINLSDSNIYPEAKIELCL